MDEINNLQNTSQPLAENSIKTPKIPFGSWWKACLPAGRLGILVVGLVLAASLFFAASKYSQKQPPIVTSPTRVPTRLPPPPQLLSFPYQQPPPLSPMKPLIGKYIKTKS